MRKSKKRKLLIVFGVLALLVLGGYVFINANLRPALLGLAEARVRSIAANAMNEAILDTFQDDDIYNSLVDIHETGSSVYLLQANSGKINALASICAQAAQDHISSLGEQGVSIAIGTITGIPLLAGRGPRLTVSFTPVGSVHTSFESEFRSAGINQTLHRINLHMDASVRIILPGISHTVNVTGEATIAESIIVGGVPNAYTNVEDENRLFDLLPDDD